MLKLSNRITIRHTQLGHTIESRAFDACLGDLPGYSPRAQVIAKDDLETKHSSLCQRTAMIARFLLPALTPDATYSSQILVTRQGRRRAIAMLPETGIAAWWHTDEVDLSRLAGIVEFTFVIGSISADLLNWARGFFDQLLACFCIIHACFGQDHRLDLMGRLVHTQVQLAPGAAFGGAMLAHFPLAFPVDFQARAVHHNVQRAAGRGV